MQLHVVQQRFRLTQRVLDLHLLGVFIWLPDHGQFSDLQLQCPLGVFVEHGCADLLGLPTQVGWQLEAVEWIASLLSPTMMIGWCALKEMRFNLAFFLGTVGCEQMVWLPLILSSTSRGQTHQFGERCLSGRFEKHLWQCVVGEKEEGRFPSCYHEDTCVLCQKGAPENWKVVLFFRARYWTNKSLRLLLLLRHQGNGT